MRRARGGATLIAALLAATVQGGPTPAAAQLGPRVGAVGVSPDTVTLGDRFDLTFTLSLPSGGVAFLPDSIEGSGFAPAGPTEWSVTPGPAGVDELRVVYPMLAFDVGTIAIEEFDVFTAPADEAIAAGFASPGDRIGSWGAFRGGPAAAPSARLATVPEQRLEVLSMLVLDGVGDRIEPRPRADVAGGSRSWPATLLVLLFGAALAASLTGFVRDWLARGRASLTALDPRARALARLDELLAAGLHRAGRTKEFFTSTSEIVREYVEAFDPRWSRAWTSTELMADLEARLPDATAPEVVREMHDAERVKFGGARPDPLEAEGHGNTLRAWLTASAPPPREGAGRGAEAEGADA